MKTLMFLVFHFQEMARYEWGKVGKRDGIVKILYAMQKIYYHVCLLITLFEVSLNYHFNCP